MILPPGDTPSLRAMGRERSRGNSGFREKNELRKEPRTKVLWRGLWLPEWRGGNRSEGGQSGGWGVNAWRLVYVRLKRFHRFWPVVRFIPRWKNAFGASKGPITGIRTIKKRFHASLACFERPSAVQEWEKFQTLQNETRALRGSCHFVAI